MKYEWQGDLEDDCTLQVGPYFCHAEAMGEVRVQPLEDGKVARGESFKSVVWYCQVAKDGEPVFHTAEPEGLVLGGEMAREICEAIVDGLVRGMEGR